MLRRRLLQGVLLLFVASMVSFAFAELTPGDYFDDLLLDPTISPQTVEAMRERYGLGEPLHIRYGRWLASLARGDFGYSLAHRSAVGPLLAIRVRNTLYLTLTATLLTWLIALPLATWVAATPKTWVRRLFSGSTSALLSIPDLMLALLLLLFAVKSGLFPVGGIASIDYDELGFFARIIDLAWHLFLPVTALVLTMLPALMRQIHASVEEVLASPYIQAAEARGLTRTSVLLRHALAAASNPLISLFGLSIASLLSVSLLVEFVLGWPGLGPLLLRSILARDVDVVIGAVLLSTILLVLGNLLADALLWATDPRIRVPSERRK